MDHQHIKTDAEKTLHTIFTNTKNVFGLEARRTSGTKHRWSAECYLARCELNRPILYLTPRPLNINQRAGGAATSPASHPLPHLIHSNGSPKHAYTEGAVNRRIKCIIKGVIRGVKTKRLNRKN